MSISSASDDIGKLITCYELQFLHVHCVQKRARFN